MQNLLYTGELFHSSSFSFERYSTPLPGAQLPKAITEQKWGRPNYLPSISFGTKLCLPCKGCRKSMCSFCMVSLKLTLKCLNVLNSADKNTEYRNHFYVYMYSPCGIFTNSSSFKDIQGTLAKDLARGCLEAWSSLLLRNFKQIIGNSRDENPGTAPLPFLLSLVTPLPFCSPHFVPHPLFYITSISTVTFTHTQNWSGVCVCA